MINAVRWLGAFGHGASLRDAFTWEFAATREVAAEWWDTNAPLNWSERLPATDANLTRCLVGLRVKRGAIKRRFYNDAWTAPRGKRLVPTRHGSYYHTEAICAPVYDSIIIRRPMGQLPPKVRADVEWAARKYGLPVLVLDHSRGLFVKLK